MVNNISWASYWYALAIIGVIYYISVALLYYKEELLQVFKTNKNRSSSKIIWTPQPAAVTGSYQESTIPGPDETERIVQSLIDELNAFFDEAKKSKWVKEELLYAVKKLVTKYSSVRNSVYRESVNNLIAVQCDHICSVRLNAEEVDHVWIG
jgi:hypothetical protein